jgi:hypothetical protein
MVKSLGAVLLRDHAEAHTATHVIASDGKNKMKRTVKLMISMCRTTNIVTLDWLVQSAKKGVVLPCGDFRVQDKQAEKVHNFSMGRSLQNLDRHLRKGVLLLSGWAVFVCPGVAGIKKAPPTSDFRLIVEAAGAIWLPSLVVPDLDMANVVVVTSDHETKAQQKTTAAAVNKGASKRTKTWLFEAMMRQEIDLPSGQISTMA